MNASLPIATLSVVYAQDIQKVAAFYLRTLSLSILEEGSGFVVVGNTSLEIAVVRMASEVAERTMISVPPQVREGTPIKCSFWVESLRHAKAEAEATGGAIKPVASAWRWRGQLHLDGHDPEGNVVQFRSSAA